MPKNPFNSGEKDNFPTLSPALRVIQNSGDEEEDDSSDYTRYSF